MKEYTIADFKSNGYRQKPITAEGRVTPSGQYDVNDSAILTRLIQEAGRFCESYASDLFIDWMTVRHTIEDGGEFSRSFLFGFREFGVDHAPFVIARYNNEGDSARYNYRSMWRLDISADGERMEMTLGRVF